MRQAKQNKEDEAKRKKADLEEKMRKKEEASGILNDFHIIILIILGIKKI